MHMLDESTIERVALAMLDLSLPKSEWTHAGHLAAALWLCRHRHDLTAADAMRTLICRYNDAIGTANTDTGGYHHTITVASMRAVADCLARHSDDAPLDVVHAALVASRYGHTEWLLAYWRRETLYSVAARRNWVEPDLAPLPF